MTYQIWLYGTLAGHRRGRVLQESIEAIEVDRPHASPGLCMMFGEDFQGAEETEQRALVSWTKSPGRALLLLPPYRLSTTQLPVEWTSSIRGVPAKGTSGLSKLLASEIRYELQGRLQQTPITDSAWLDLSVCTAMYQHHISAGIFVITCLPLWSLTALDHPKMLNRWLEEIYALAGKPKTSDTEQTDTGPFVPTPEHFSLMLHLLTQEFGSQEEALSALEESHLFSIKKETALPLLTSLQESGYVKEAKVQEEGLRVIKASPFAAYAEAVKESRT